MKIKSLIAASVVAIAAATSAQAADVVAAREPVPAVAAVPAFSWTGFYAGGQIGGSWADSKVENDLTFSPDPSGFIGGLYAGFNYDLGNNVVLGAETDWVWADMDKSKSDGIFSAKLKEKWAGATRVRIGYAVDRWLPFVAGGVAYSKVDSYFYNPVETRGSDTMTGWTVGAGVDYAVTDNVVVRLEYRYSDFGDKTYESDFADYKVDYKTNDVQVGVAYKF